MSMSEYLDAREYGRRFGNSKEMYTITYNQQLRDWGMSAYLNYSHQTYWDKPANDRYNLTLSRYFDVGRFKTWDCRCRHIVIVTTSTMTMACICRCRCRGDWCHIKLQHDAQP